jgi:hypothetical protein
MVFIVSEIQICLESEPRLGPWMVRLFCLGANFPYRSFSENLYALSQRQCPYELFAFFVAALFKAVFKKEIQWFSANECLSRMLYQNF